MEIINCQIVKEAIKNIGQEVSLINGEKVLLIKLIGNSSCMVLSGPDLDKYTYVQLKDLRLCSTKATV